MKFKINKFDQNTIGGISAFTVSGLLMISLLSLSNDKTISNWLVLLFKLNTGTRGINYNLLHYLNLWDIVILGLVSIVLLCLNKYFDKSHKIWAFISFIQPVLGIILLVTTKVVGRSAVMGGVLVISILMMTNKTFDKIIAFTGISTSILLLTGDFVTTEVGHSIIIASFIGIGYILLIIWFLLVGRKILILEKNKQ